MKQSRRNAAAVTLFIAALVAVSVVIAVSRAPITGWFRLAVPVGWILIALGCAIDIWALAHIRLGVAGRVAPLLQRLVHQGPYRYVRHPIYLGLLLILAGVALRLGSWLGVAATIGLLLPSVIYRVQLEEKALELRFGQDWNDHRRMTGLLLPRIHRTRNRQETEHSNDS